jgi:hypothetical protein
MVERPPPEDLLIRLLCWLFWLCSYPYFFAELVNQVVAMYAGKTIESGGTVDV